MQQIIFFFIRNKNFLLFGVLFLISLIFTIRSHSFHTNKYVSSANVVSGGVYSAKNNITDYFGLKIENQRLVEENIRLRKMLEGYKENVSSEVLDSTQMPSKYNFIAAKIINNSYSKTKNNLTINKGARDSLKIDMGVITTKGIVGIINNVSNKYATIQSILNTRSQINARLKNSNHFGSLVWDTKEPNVVQLIDVNRLAPVKIGDTIITDGKSTIFPEGILIGTIKEFKLGQNDSYDLDIQLFNDMTNLEHVYIIENKDAKEIKMLEKNLIDAK